MKPNNQKDLTLRAIISKLADRIAEIEKDEEVQKLYFELLYAVERKHPNETRHQTALRYIQQAERKDLS